MTRIAILPEPADSGRMMYRAIAGERQSLGNTAGEALNALASLLPASESATVVVVQHHRPDSLFTVAQQQRLQELMARWRSAREAGTRLPDSDQAELDALIEAELDAAGKRTSALLREMER
jgi:hypothetical protein